MEHENRQDMRWEHTIAELFATQVRSRPRATAVSFAGTDLSYAELDARSDRIAGRLAEHGVGPDAVVAVRVDRGPDLIAALLGVLGALMAIPAAAAVQAVVRDYWRFRHGEEPLPPDGARAGAG